MTLSMFLPHREAAGRDKQRQGPHVLQVGVRQQNGVHITRDLLQIILKGKLS